MVIQVSCIWCVFGKAGRVKVGIVDIVDHKAQIYSMWEGMAGWERGRISCRLPLLSQPPSHQSPWWGGRVQPAQNIATPAHFDVKILPPSPLNVKNRTPPHSQFSKYCKGGSCYAKIKVSQDPKEPKMTMGFPEYTSLYALLLLSNLDNGGTLNFEWYHQVQITWSPSSPKL